MTETLHHRICPLCEACCGLEITVQDGRVTRIRGDASDPFSGGYLCPKGVALNDLHEDPDRLRRPLVKRQGVFHEVSWDEAYAEIARRLPAVQAQHGRHAVAVVAGNPTSHKLGLMLYLPRLLKALGSRSMYSAATLDQMPRHVVSGLLYGHWMTVPIPDIARCQWLMVLGANPLASNGSMWTVPDFKGKAKALQARGGRLVVVDPRRTETAALADEHHAIRPGADVYLLLGLLHTLLHEGLARPGRAADWVDGLDELPALVAPYPPEAVAARCGLAADTIRRLARDFAQTPGAALYGRIGTCTQDFGTLSTWLIDLLNLLGGDFDAPGGTMFAKAAAFAANTAGTPGRGRGVVLGRHHSRVSGAPEIMGELPITCLPEDLLTPGEGQVRALITLATNPVLSSPGGAQLAQALEGLDFMLSLDIYLNETTRHADVILPGPSPLEDLHYDVPYPQMSWRNHARFSAPVLPRASDQPAEWESLMRIAAIARGDDWQTPVQALDDRAWAEDTDKLWGDQAAAVRAASAGLRGPERLLDSALRHGPYRLSLAEVAAQPQGLDLGELQPRLPELLRTPHGRITLVPELLRADLARAAAALAEPAPTWTLIGRREVRSNNSWMHNLPTLAKGPERCTLLMHPADAQRLGVAEGDAVRVSTTVATLTAPVRLSTDMMPGVVSLPHGWGHDQPGTQLNLARERPGVNMNALLDVNRRDPLSGNAVLSGMAVQLTPATAA